MPTTCAAMCLGSLLLGQLPPPPMPVDPAFRQELLQLQGSWQIESLLQNGKKADADEFKGRTLLFAGDNLLIRGPGKIREAAVLKFGITKKPKTINATVVQGANRGTTMLGIYALEGDVLKICLDQEGEERPKEFTALAESKHTLFICKRVRGSKDEQDLVGKYRSVATGFDGQEYSADAVIERIGDGYSIQYTVSGVPAYSGFGVRKGNAMSMYWVNQGQPGITIYQIEPGRLVGRYMQLAGAGVLEEEILTRVEGKDAKTTPSTDAGR